MYKIIAAFCLLVYPTALLFSQEKKLSADENNALLHVTVTDMEDKIRKQDIIVFEGTKSGIQFQGVSGADGKFDIMLPEGDVYLIKIIGIGKEEDYSSLEIGNEEGIYEADITVGYEPAKSFTLENVNFDINKASLRPDSYKALDNLVKVLKIKSDLKVEIAGHTDSEGDDVSNMKLSQARAETVVKYLVSKGVKATQLMAQGYGETEPIEDNETEKGRQLNRRTEARILE